MPKTPARKPPAPRPRTRKDAADPDWERWTRSVQIREVAIDSLEFCANRERLSAEPPPTLNATYRLGDAADSVKADTMRLGFEFELFLSEEEGGKATPENAVIHLKMTCHALYALTENEEPKANHVERFKKGLAAAHVYPFVRAHVADLFMRAGLPPLYLPLGHFSATATLRR
jgi:hypothetical protein